MFSDVPCNVVKGTDSIYQDMHLWAGYKKDQYRSFYSGLWKKFPEYDISFQLNLEENENLTLKFTILSIIIDIEVQ